MIYSKFYSASDVRLKEFPAVQWLRLCTLTAEVQSLVRKLRSHKPHGAAKKKKKSDITLSLLILLCLMYQATYLSIIHYCINLQKSH